MSITVHWSDIALRLLLSAMAGMAIGLDRETHGHPAGLRTTVLVSLAACIAMIQANLLLDIPGKTSDSFAVADVMRLPLGILSGMGFIGAGAILRRGDIIVGVTTAATLWFVTVMGLCFGGGQIALGLCALALAMGAIWCLKPLEDKLIRHQHAMLHVTLEEGPVEGELREALAAAGFRISSAQVTYNGHEHRRDLVWDVRWRAVSSDEAPPFLGAFADRPTVLKLTWNPEVSTAHAR